METIKTTPKEVQKKVGENIEYYRLLSKKTIKEMAALMQMTDSGYRNIERGFTKITIVAIYQIADILNIEPSLLIDSNESKNLKNKSSSDLITDKLNEAFYKQRTKEYQEEVSFLKTQLKIMNDFISKKGSLLFLFNCLSSLFLL